MIITISNRTSQPVSVPEFVGFPTVDDDGNLDGLVLTGKTLAPGEWECSTALPLHLRDQLEAAGLTVTDGVL